VGEAVGHPDGVQLVHAATVSQRTGVHVRPVLERHQLGSLHPYIRHSRLEFFLIVVVLRLSADLAVKLRHHQPKSKASPYSIAERRVPELIPVLGSQRLQVT